MRPVAVVFQGDRGFITDFGESQTARLISDLEADPPIINITIPRYGVWKPNTKGVKPEVTMATDDYDEALKEARR
jgi:hypothetical protein